MDMTKNILLLSLLSLLSIFSISLCAEKYYATPDGNDSNDGKSWATAKTLDGVLTSSALADGDEIFVKKGTYTAPENGSFTCDKAAVSVYGNCKGTETEKPEYDLDNIETYLKGNGSRVLTITTASTFAGFDISDGDASKAVPDAGRGGGVHANHAESRVSYCIIHGNAGMKQATIPGTSLSGIGGGMHLKGVAENCIIKNNIAGEGETSKRGVGGGVRMDGSAAKLINCIVSDNQVVTEDTKVGNGNNIGGGISATGGDIINCLVSNNAIGGPNNNSNCGGGIDLSLASNPVQVINCTLTNNTASGKGGGIGFKTNKNIFIKNCIVWNNTARPEASETNNITLITDGISIQYTLWPEAEAENTDHNLNADPLLTANEYKLQNGSPAIDAGDGTAISSYAKDLAGNNRIIGETVDLGAYEYNGKISTGVNQIEANDGLIQTLYYTLSGLQVPEPEQPGIYIVKKIYASQKQTSQKIFIPVK